MLEKRMTEKSERWIEHERQQEKRLEEERSKRKAVEQQLEDENRKTKKAVEQKVEDDTKRRQLSNNSRTRSKDGGRYNNNPHIDLRKS